MNRSTTLPRLLAVIALAFGLVGFAGACTAGTPTRTGASAGAQRAGDPTNAQVKAALEAQGFSRVLKAWDLGGQSGIQTLAELQFPSCHKSITLTVWPLTGGKRYGLEVAIDQSLVQAAPNLIIGERGRPQLTGQPTAAQIKQFKLCGS